jgi:hypothetical protein
VQIRSEELFINELFLSNKMLDHQVRNSLGLGHNPELQVPELVVQNEFQKLNQAAGELV